MVVLVCQHPHCNADAIDEVIYPLVRWMLCADHAAAEHDFAAQVRAMSESGPLCALPGCSVSQKTRGLCDPHYQRIRRRGLALPQQQAEAAAALDALPGTPPSLSAELFEQPAWIQRRAEALSAEFWARLRQDLYSIAGRSL
ncbi:MAG: hypothetical protein ACI8RZ_003777 [Myxococcota bacterium]|jgi:hypothetical protein